MDRNSLPRQWRKKDVLDVVSLSNGWYLLKTKNSKSEKDFLVRTVLSLHPRRSITPKHAHFAIDFYGKLCADSDGAIQVLQAIWDVWAGKPPEQVLGELKGKMDTLPGYPPEYILFALRWILEQEDVNFRERPQKKQEQLDQILGNWAVALKRNIPAGRQGSRLAMALFCDIAAGVHPVEALLRANLRRL